MGLILEVVRNNGMMVYGIYIYVPIPGAMQHILDITQSAPEFHILGCFLKEQLPCFIPIINMED